MKNLAAYFEARSRSRARARDAELVKLGQQIYRGGIMSKGVAACASCHGPNGAGIPAQFPRVAGQYAEYTAAQLKAFRARRARQRSEPYDARSSPTSSPTRKSRRSRNTSPGLR